MTLDDAVRYFGSKNKLAIALGINRQAIQFWNGKVPIRRQYELEELTNGRLKRKRKRVKTPQSRGADRPEG